MSFYLQRRNVLRGQLHVNDAFLRAGQKGC